MSTVTDCFNKSFESDSDLDSMNILLEEDTLIQTQLGIFMHPGLTMNKLTYRGYIEGEDIFEAICTTFEKKPHVCSSPFDEELELDFSSDPKV